MTTETPASPSVHAFVVESIRAFPSLHRSRADVLEFVLCTIGTGFEWQPDGTLAYAGGREDSTGPWTPEQEYEHLNAYPPVVRDVLQKSFDERVREYSAIVENAEELAESMELRGEVYPQSDYAPLMNVPANVRPDWKLAVEEITVMARAAGWKL